MTEPDDGPAPEPPVISERVDVDLPLDIVARVDQIAADAEMTRAEVLRRLIEAELDPPPGTAVRRSPA